MVASFFRSGSGESPVQGLSVLSWGWKKTSTSGIIWRYVLAKCRHKLQAVLFWVKLLKMDHDRLCSKMLKECTELTNFHQTNCWVSQVKEILNEYNLSVWWQSHIGLSVKEVNEVITSCLFWVERDKWKNNIQTKPKLRIYRLLIS